MCVLLLSQNISILCFTYGRKKAKCGNGAFFLERKWRAEIAARHRAKIREDIAEPIHNRVESSLLLVVRMIEQVVLRKRCSNELFTIPCCDSRASAERELNKDDHPLVEEQYDDEWIKKPKVTQSTACTNLTNESILKAVQQLSRGEAHYLLRQQVLTRLELHSHLVNLLQLCQGSVTFLCQLIDVNIFSKNIIELLANSDGTRLASLNIQCHHFSVTSDKSKLLNAFCFSYVNKNKPCNIVAYVLQTLFCADSEASICVVQGSGVACVLLADFCRMYGLTEFLSNDEGEKKTWPALLMISAFPSGRTILVPVF